ncbi:MAG: nitroreductase [Clostridiaceae bacterium]|nr:nitroreductase [Clostridiaceae bacterium]
MTDNDKNTAIADSVADATASRPTSFAELARRRHTVRKFTAESVTDEQLAAVLETTSMAMTAANRQPQRWFAIRSDAARAAVEQCTTSLFDPPLYLLLAFDADRVWRNRYDGHDSGEVDSAIAGTFLSFALEEQGLASCWIGSFDRAKLTKLLGLPDNLRPVALFAVGHPVPAPEPPKIRNPWENSFATL